MERGGGEPHQDWDSRWKAPEGERRKAVGENLTGRTLTRTWDTLDQSRDLDWGQGGVDPDPDQGGREQGSKWKAFQKAEKVKSSDPVVCLCLDRREGHFSWMQ